MCAKFHLDNLKNETWHGLIGFPVDVDWEYIYFTESKMYFIDVKQTSCQNKYTLCQDIEIKAIKLTKFPK